MSIIKIGKDNLERFSAIARPRRTFSSSSSGVTGSVPVFAKSSGIQKEVSGNVEPLRDAASKSTSTNIRGAVENYLREVNDQTKSIALDREVESIRFIPPFDFDSNYLRKQNVKNVLFPFYRHKNSYAHWAFTNYQCLNFFSSSTVPTSSVIIYDNQVLEGDRGPYTPDGALSLECYLNPKYQNVQAGEEFSPGTIFHLSSTFSLSLCSGSSVDGNGKVDKFRLLLQLSSSAEVDPGAALPGAFTFFSDDNCLNLNHWHHVVVRWSPDYDNGSGSFVVDGVERGFFHVTASSISPIFNGTSPTAKRDQDALFIGNFYKGRNDGVVRTSRFFQGDPDIYPACQFNFPLQAEVHEIRVWDKYLNDDDISAYISGGVGTATPDNLMLYVPVLFTKESPARKIMITPAIESYESTVDALNVSMSFSVGGHEVNVENFTREFVQGTYPTLYDLTGTIQTSTDSVMSANDILYATGTFAKRNLTVFPCDNGKTRPDYTILQSGTLVSKPSNDSQYSKFINDFGNLDLSLVNLSNLLPDSLINHDLTIEDEGVSFSSSVVPIFQRQRDSASNSVTFFDTSNLFYGGKIHPTSLEIFDSSLTGSSGRIGMTFRDNGHGGIYRADALTPHAKWAGVGTVLYEEGIAVLKSPLVFLFGKEQFDISMRGERPVHVMEISVPCPAGQINLSTNPTFASLLASDDPNETSTGPVIITGVNLHDDNLNVVARVTLAQPIIKRSEDRYLFRIKMDW